LYLFEKAKKLGISVNGTYDSISKFKENKGNLQKFINYVTALDKKVQFVFKKENTVIRNCWTAGTLLEFIMEKESIKTKELPDKLHKTYQELCRQLKSLKENKSVAKEKNPASKKYFLKFYDQYIDIPKGYLYEFCASKEIKYTTIYNTLKTKQAVTKGAAKGYQLFEGTYEK
jgi:hypothetical protein